jgi:long-chain fatty acid transport protein
MRVSSGVLAAAATLASAGTQAGGFAVLAQSASVNGNAYSGAAATAEDASTIWYNPAGMARLPGTQVSINANAIRTSFRYHDGGSTGAFANPGSGDGGDGGGLALVPQAYLSTDLGEGWWAGFALNTPFGQKTEYDDGWRGQFVALKSEAKSLNINIALAHEVNKSWSIGGGLDVQRFETELTNFAGPLGSAKLEANDVSWGYNLGVMFNASDLTRVGLAYRSKIVYELSGNATFSGNGAANTPARTDLTVPETLSLSAFTALSHDWEFVGTVTWTRWGRLQTLSVTRPDGSQLTAFPFKWRNTVFFGAGANYKPSDAWKIRAGIAYDPAVSNDETRTPRLPDQRRWIVSAGARYAASKNDSFDLAYVHDFIKEASVNNTVAGVPGALVGSFTSSADVLSVQYNHQF